MQSEDESIEFWCEELAELTDSLFVTLPTSEIVMKEFIVRQTENAATDDRELILIKGNSNTSLPSLDLAPAKDLLRLDLQLIAAMQNSLNDTKFAKYMDHKNRKFDAIKMHKDLEEGSRQMQYWAKHLAEADKDRAMTSATQQAMVLNLARVARAFGMSVFPSSVVKINHAQIRQLRSSNTRSLLTNLMWI